MTVKELRKMLKSVDPTYDVLIHDITAGEISEAHIAVSKRDRALLVEP